MQTVDVCRRLRVVAVNDPFVMAVEAAPGKDDVHPPRKGLGGCGVRTFRPACAHDDLDAMTCEGTEGGDRRAPDGLILGVVSKSAAAYRREGEDASTDDPPDKLLIFRCHAEHSTGMVWGHVNVSSEPGEGLILR